VSATPAYQLDSLVHRFGGRLALELPSLTLAAGKIHGLLGPNGAGKSTLLQILALLLRPDEGTLHIAGQDPYGRGGSNGGGLRALRRDVTLIHQRPVLFDTSVYGNLAFGLRARGLKRDAIDQAVTRALTEVDLPGFGTRAARKLSGGEAQRVIVARALVLDTPILLLDEPTSYLDDDARPLLVELLRRRNAERNTTVVIATHDRRFADDLADGMVFLRRGGLDQRR
jgi:tungstate transport system ATP-binding protein